MADNEENENQSLLEPQPWELDEGANQPHPLIPVVIYGVQRWSDIWSNWDLAGTGHDIPWNVYVNQMQHYYELLNDYGYLYKYNIKVLPDKHDHQIVCVSGPTEDADTSDIKRCDFACKIVSLGYHKGSRGRAIDGAVRDFLVEADILLRLAPYKHKNIIRLYDWIDLKDSQTDFPYNYSALIMDLMDGSLTDLMKKQRHNSLSPEMCKLWARDIAKALVFLHHGNKQKLDHKKQPIRGHDGRPIVENFTVVHMAIKPRNVLYKLIQINYKSKYVFKLADFEECYVYEHHPQDTEYLDLLPDWAVTTKPSNSHLQRAPELDPDNKPHSSLHTPPMDMYSLGASVDYTYTCRKKFDRQQLIQDLRGYTSSHMTDFVAKLTDPTPYYRLTAKMALKHPFLANN